MHLCLEVGVAALAVVGHLVGLDLGVRQDVVHAAGRDRREPRVPGGLRHLPDVGSEQVVRPELGGVAQVGGPLAREVDHERAVGVVDLARPAAAGAVRQGVLDAALEVLRHAQAHAVDREPHPLGD